MNIIRAFIKGTYIQFRYRDKLLQKTTFFLKFDELYRAFFIFNVLEYVLSHNSLNKFGTNEAFENIFHSNKIDRCVWKQHIIVVKRVPSYRRAKLSCGAWILKIIKLQFSKYIYYIGCAKEKTWPLIFSIQVLSMCGWMEERERMRNEPYEWMNSRNIRIMCINRYTSWISIHTNSINIRGIFYRIER